MEKKRTTGRYPQAFRKMAVERRKGCDNIVALSAELGVHRRLLYKWRDQLEPIDDGQAPPEIGGVDVNKPRMQAVLSAALALACSPKGFTARQFSAAVRSILGPGQPNYDPRRAAYDLKKLRGKEWLRKIHGFCRYCISAGKPSGRWELW